MVLVPRVGLALAHESGLQGLEEWGWPVECPPVAARPFFLFGLFRGLLANARDACAALRPRLHLARRTQPRGLIVSDERHVFALTPGHCV